MIQHILDAVDQLLVELETPAAKVPRLRSTNLAPISPDERARRIHLEERWYHAQPEQTAALSSLAAASALLRVTQLLLNRSASPSPKERFQEWNDLSELTKEAGRSAYRAALILADPECAVPSGC
ncbi:hypothetical protein ACSFA8_04920 [Variovorax sp. RT4R15]|uniref:hypothetical protein n=1 Tax=Variovorax sp. RT4R15 TaxID=3443737 RepID=UPI003F4610DF